LLRIMGGIDRGRKLKGPQGTEFRPSTGRVKEFIFSYLYDVSEYTVLDLFSGTGSIGIEAISRGAAGVTFVEQSYQSLKILKENIETCHYSDRTSISRGDVFQVLDQLGDANTGFNLIIADPPFKGMLRQRIKESVARNGLLKKDGLLIIEHEQHDSDMEIENIKMIKQKKFGHCVISIYGV